MKKIYLTLLCALTCLTLSVHAESPLSDLSSEPQEALDISSYSTADVAWGLGKDRDENNQPVDAIKANEKYSSLNAVFVGRNENKIYLTFDNGYENGNTPAILDILKQKNVHAVFFLTGQYIVENPELVKRMIAEGHIIGNHTSRHKSFIEATNDEISQEITDFDKQMMAQFNYLPTLVRPPKGEFHEQALAITKSLGHQTVLWSFAYYDYNVNDQMSPEGALSKCLEGAHPGAIYLLHSVSTTNVKILADLIDQLRAKGYTISDYDL